MRVEAAAPAPPATHAQQSQPGLPPCRNSARRRKSQELRQCAVRAVSARVEYIGQTRVRLFKRLMRAYELRGDGSRLADRSRAQCRCHHAQAAWRSRRWCRLWVQVGPWAALSVVFRALRSSATQSAGNLKPETKMFVTNPVNSELNSSQEQQPPCVLPRSGLKT